MGKVKYNKETKQFEKAIMINGVSANVIFSDEETLKKLPYRIRSKWKSNKQEE